ncbi:MAG: MFS transporter [Kiritimatiellales bacterium]|nr:MFS transporter [Kiritimatiellales bacterium]MCF7864485.1 MFS transporter [Kiritimatiellales bacterium]
MSGTTLLDGKQTGAQKVYVWAICLVAAIGGFLFGFDMGLIAGAVLYLEPEFALGAAAKGLVVASATLGCIAGPLFGLWIADALGRKKGLLIAAICFLLSAIGTAVAKELVPFIFWRMVGGIGVGLASVISPMYIAEIAPARLRGRLVVVNQLTIVLGLFLSVLVTYLLAGSVKFVPSDIQNTEAFVQTVQQEMQSNSPNPGKRLFDVLPEVDRQRLLGGKADDMVAALNTVLADEDFYQDISFAQTVLVDKAQRFVARDISAMPPLQLEMLNRLLLENAYPELISKSFIASGDNWRWMFASEILFILAFSVGLALVPNSPRWLAMKGRRDDAWKVLVKVNGAHQAEAELASIQQELGKESGTMKELFLPGIRLAVLIGVMLMIFQQINGVNAIFIYSPTIFMDAGLTSESSAILRSVYLYSWIIVCTTVSFWLIGKFSRRGILIYSVAGIAFGHLLMAVNFLFEMPPLFALGVIFWSAACFTLGLAPLGWVVLSEIFPNRIRGKAMSLACFLMFLCNFIDKQIFPISLQFFSERFGNPSGTYFIYSGICLCCVWFVWRFLPETKDKTLEEISEFWLMNTESKKDNKQ